MAILRKDLKILSLNKNIGGKFDLVEFAVGYKRKPTGVLNYNLSLELLLNQEEFGYFMKFYDENCVSGFNAYFEILRQNEFVTNFFYKFKTEPVVSQHQGEYFKVSLSLIRIIEGCPYDFIVIYNALNNIKENLKGNNRSDSLYVACPISFQNLGVALTNIYNTLEVTPYDYKLSYTFA